MCMEPMEEVLLTVLALSQEGYKGPLTWAIPKRLQGTLRTARKKGFVEVDQDGAYLSEEGCYALGKAF